MISWSFNEVELRENNYQNRFAIDHFLRKLCVNLSYKAEDMELSRAEET